LVGNGVTNWKYDTTPAYLEMSFWHSLLSHEDYKKTVELKCDFSRIFFGSEPVKECMDIYNKWADYVKKVNIYNIFGICYGLKPDDPNAVNPNEMGFV